MHGGPFRAVGTRPPRETLCHRIERRRCLAFTWRGPRPPGKALYLRRELWCQSPFSTADTRKLRRLPEQNTSHKPIRSHWRPSLSPCKFEQGGQIARPVPCFCAAELICRLRGAVGLGSVTGTAQVHRPHEPTSSLSSARRKQQRQKDSNSLVVRLLARWEEASEIRLQRPGPIVGLLSGCWWVMGCWRGVR